jgi:hypothetical protein
MIQNGLSTFLILAGRAIAGLIIALLLAFLGDVAGRVFNLSVGYPWSLAVHQNIHLIFIGAGAGLGAYLCWMPLNFRWYSALSWAGLALAGGIGGAYLGHFYGPGVDPTYWWSPFATDTTIHLSATGVSVAAAAALGVIHDRRTKARLRAAAKPLPPLELSLTRTPDQKK